MATNVDVIEIPDSNDEFTSDTTFDEDFNMDLYVKAEVEYQLNRTNNTFPIYIFLNINDDNTTEDFNLKDIERWIKLGAEEVTSITKEELDKTQYGYLHTADGFDYLAYGI